MINKPYSQSCENNKAAIVDILKQAFSNTKHVLEIGSGTGQHAAFFGQQLPHLTWQTSDLAINHQGINLWLDEASCANVKSPITLDLSTSWNIQSTNIHDSESNNIDGLYTANTLHIISWPLVVKFFEGIAQNVVSGAHVCIYGPFNYQGKYTSESNADFDLWLKERDEKSGIRDIESILMLANEAGLKLIEDHDMPANNRLLVFAKLM